MGRVDYYTSNYYDDDNDDDDDDDDDDDQYYYTTIVIIRGCVDYGTRMKDMWHVGRGVEDDPDHVELRHVLEMFREFAALRRPHLC